MHSIYRIIHAFFGLSLAIAALPSVTEGQIFVRDGGVGYIDSAILGNQFRLRAESAFQIDRSNRAEFLWAWPQPLGPGPNGDESSVGYDSLAAYLEYLVRDDLSLFVEVAGLGVDPQILDNTAGLGDLQAGFKWALQSCPDRLTTFQLRVFAPTGDADRGLGSGHASLEPALLHLQPLSASWTLEAELRYWIPLDGTEERAGSVVRYGLGASHRGWGLGCGAAADGIQVRPVVEAVGWTVVDGQARYAAFPGGPVIVEDVDGDTIVNLKLGARLAVSCCDDVYLGYGRSLTGRRWYEDVARLEWRRAF